MTSLNGHDHQNKNGYMLQGNGIFIIYQETLLKWLDWKNCGEFLHFFEIFQCLYTFF